MNPDLLWQYSATELHQAFLQAEATPLQALHSCLQRITAVQPQINAFVALRSASAEQEAAASTLRYQRGSPLSPLDGVPISIKDNLLTHDMPTTWGSAGLAHYQPDSEELAVRRLRAAGAIVVGKTNVPEFTLEGYTDNPLFGVTRNPWDLALTPGGSSGGAAASVAAGCTPLALGTDGGGSIRRPAAHCGLVGLKPTTGCVARVQGLPTLLLDFEVVALMARTVADITALLAVIAGPDAADPASWAPALPAAAGPAPSSRLRLLYVPTLDQAPVDAGIAQACAHAAQQLAHAGGHLLDSGPLPLHLADITSAWPQVAQIGLAHLFQQQPAWGAAASEKYRQMAADGAALPATALWRILDLTAQLRRDCVALFSQWDIVLMPCTATQPWPAEQAYPAMIDGQPVGPRGHAAFTGWINAAGLPALSIPVTTDAQGLPIGLQLVGPPGAEPLLLQQAARMQALQPWEARRPALSTRPAA